MFSLKSTAVVSSDTLKNSVEQLQALNAPINVEFNPADAADVQRAISLDRAHH